VLEYNKTLDDPKNPTVYSKNECVSPIYARGLQGQGGAHLQRTWHWLLLTAPYTSLHIPTHSVPHLALYPWFSTSSSPGTALSRRVENPKTLLLAKSHLPLHRFRNNVKQAPLQPVELQENLV
jgi:hypothetical protein